MTITDIVGEPYAKSLSIVIVVWNGRRTIMRSLRIIANLPVADIGVAKDFYTDFLGLNSEEFNVGLIPHDVSGTEPISR